MEDFIVRCFLDNLLRIKSNKQFENDYNYNSMDNIIDSMLDLTLNSIINAIIKHTVKKSSLQ